MSVFVSGSSATIDPPPIPKEIRCAALVLLASYGIRVVQPMWDAILIEARQETSISARRLAVRYSVALTESIRWYKEG